MFYLRDQGNTLGQV